MNNKLKLNNEGVSPVIGVILMVAITVVLAAVVFVLVQNLGKDVEMPVNVSMLKQDEGETYLVHTIDRKTIGWTQVETRGCDTVLDSDGNGVISAGDSITECGDDVLLIYHNKIIWSN
jgi:flagellin-like protein